MATSPGPADETKEGTKPSPAKSDLSGVEADRDELPSPSTCCMGIDSRWDTMVLWLFPWLLRNAFKINEERKVSQSVGRHVLSRQI